MDGSQMDRAHKKKEGLAIHLGRPSNGVLSSFDPMIAAKLLALREEYEHWGSRTLYIELKKDMRLQGMRLPKVSSIHAFLLSKDLVKTYQKHRPLPTKRLYKPTNCHEIWQIDGKGTEQIAHLGAIAWLNIKDIFSRLYVVGFPAQLKSRQHHPSTTDYQAALRLGFVQRGLPQKIQCDHASVFYDNKSKSPFPTLFHLWLVALNIELLFTRVHTPTDQAEVERCNQVFWAQVKRKQAFDLWLQLYEWGQARLQRLNEDIPCASLQNQPPLVAYPQARHSGKFYSPHGEEQLLDLNRVYQYLQQGEWFRKVSSAKTIALGGQTYYISKAQKGQQLRIKFKSQNTQLLFYNDEQKVIAKQKIIGIDKPTLMGQTFHVFQRTNAQLELPFEWEEQKKAFLFQANESTT